MLGAGAGKTECGGGEGVAGDTEDREGFGQTAGAVVRTAVSCKKNNKQGFFPYKWMHVLLQFGIKTKNIS